jgi:hypothetical protein
LVHQYLKILSDFTFSYFLLICRISSDLRFVVFKFDAISCDKYTFQFVIETEKNINLESVLMVELAGLFSKLVLLVLFMHIHFVFTKLFTFVKVSFWF